MSIRFPDDTILPPTAEPDTRSAWPKAAVFIPIAIALIGVGVILLGGLPVRDPASAISGAERIDPVVTGSILPISDAGRRQALEMLDR